MSRGWSRVALGDILEQSVEPEAVERERSYPLLGIIGFGGGAFGRPPLAGSDIAASVLYRVRAGQIVYRKLTAFEGTFAFIPAALDGYYVSSEFPVFRVDERRALPEFIALCLGRPAAWRELADLTVGTATRRSRLSTEAFLEYEIDLPRLGDQGHIMATMDVVEAALSAARAEQAAGVGLLHTAMEYLVARSHGRPASGWAETQLGAISDVRSGVTKGRKTSGPLLDVPFLRAANVQDGFLDLREVKTIPATETEIARFRLEPGDVLLVEGGNEEHVGRGWLWQGEVETCLHQNHVFRARPTRERVEPRFLAYAIGSSPARRHCLAAAKRTTNLASISKREIEIMPLSLPSRLEQRLIVDRLDTLRGFAVSAGRTVARLEAMRGSLVEALMTGAVRPPQASTENAAA
jgi:type I restriction enzyme S subunit